MICTQFPLQLAVARTVHKSQSSTYSELVVNFFTKKSPPKHFWEHLIYVGLSRVPFLKGLYVVNLNAEQIRRSEKVKNYLSQEKKDVYYVINQHIKQKTALKLYLTMCAV